MKTINYFLSIGVIATSLVLSSCKKGEDDPFLSFRSRDGRITGEFTADYKFEINKTITMTGSPSANATASYALGSAYAFNLSGTNGYLQLDEESLFNPSTLVGVEMGYDEGESFSGSYNGSSGVSITIDKDGTYKFDYNATLNSYTSEDETTELTNPIVFDGSETGRWSWDNSKKNKSGITFVSDQPDAMLEGTFSITQLKEKEVVLVKKYTRNFNIGDDTEKSGETTTVTQNIVLTKK